MMANRILNRCELRKQADQAEQPKSANGVPEAVPVAKKRKVKAAGTTPKVRKPREKKPPPRMRARWGVFDATMKQVAIFDYNQRAAADQKLADLCEKKKGIHFIQIVKEPMPEPTPAAAIEA
jgi:hypothetical protein